MKTSLLALLAVVLIAPISRAQEKESDSTGGSLPVWRAVLPGGTYTVALRSITSVSTHEYVVDGAGRVTEMIIDTSGSSIARFYYIEPLTPQSPLGIGQSTLDKLQEIAEEGAERTGQDQLWKQVVKNYPATTHARTVEYRLDTKQKLERLFKSAESAFRRGRGDNIKME